MIVTTKRPDRPKPPKTPAPPPKTVKPVKPEKAYPIAWSIALVQRTDGRSHVQTLYVAKVFEKNALIAHMICNAEGLVGVKKAHEERRVEVMTIRPTNKEHPHAPQSEAKTSETSYRSDVGDHVHHSSTSGYVAPSATAAPAVLCEAERTCSRCFRLKGSPVNEYEPFCPDCDA